MSPAVSDADLLHHLPSDDLDVLVVDLHALRAVHLLHLVHEVALGGGVARVLEDVGGIDRAGRDLRALLDPVAVFHQHARTPGEDVLLGRPIVREDRQLGAALGVLDGDPARRFGEARPTLGLARLEELDDARQTMGDVRTGDAARVEGPHGELSPRLTDGLRRDMPDGVADLGRRIVRQGEPVALLAETGRRVALQHAAHRHHRVCLRSASVDVEDPATSLGIDVGIALEDDLAGALLDDGSAEVATDQVLVGFMSPDRHQVTAFAVGALDAHLGIGQVRTRPHATGRSEQDRSSRPS